MNPEMKKTDKLPRALPENAEFYIERRLSLRGGTTLREAGADLANRYYTFPLAKIASDIYADIAAFDVLDDDGTPLKMREIEKRKKELHRRWQAARDVAKAQEQEAITHYMELVRSYLIGTYGEVKRDEDGKPTGFKSGQLYIESHHLRKTALEPTL